MSDPTIYFVLAEHTRRLKIGYSIDPVGRLAALQTGCPEPLSLLGWISYDATPRQVMAIERELHDCFAQWRLQGEWFEATTELLEFVEEIRCPETAPGWRAVMELDVEPPEDPRRPQIPEGVDVPKGNSRAAILARYKLARGLAA
jgi:hypothetical protein